MKMKQKVFLASLMLLFCTFLSAETYNGTCGAQGNNLTWSLDTETGVITISGTGAMADYSAGSTPWFEYRDYSITSAVISNGITRIGNGAFWSCWKLTSVTIPNSVTSIGSDAFSFCSGLTSVTIPNSVTSIGEYAFSGCSSLTSVTIPNSVTNIGKYAFNYVPNIVYNGSATGSPWGARSINGYVEGYLVYSDATKNTLIACSSVATEVVIPNSVTSIDSKAFVNCSSLKKVTLNSNAIASKAYSSSSNLSSIFGSKVSEYILGDDVTSIGEYAFYGYSGVTSITISNNLTNIGNRAFYGCSNLTEPIYSDHFFAFMPQSYSGTYTIPNGIESIAGEAFYQCSSLTSITIPNSVTSIGVGAFYGCYGLKEVHISDIAKWCTFSFSSPNNSNHPNPLFYADNLYVNGSLVTDLVIPEGVTRIGSYAFNHRSLTSVTIPNSVTSIEYGAFANCVGLTSITIPNGVTSIGSSAFYQCVGLTSVTIGNSVTSIGESAFAGCSNITSLIIPNSAKFVTSGTSGYSNTFGTYSNLTYVEAPAPFFDIPEAQWPSYTKSLSHVTVNGGELTENALLFINRSYKTLQTLDVSGVTNTEFADEAFKGFYNLKELVLPVMLQKVSYMMVAGCKNLQSVVIPASVEEIEQSAFEDCRSLQSITFGDQQNATPARFNVPASTENRLKHIGNWAFYNAHELKSIEIPEGVEEIGEGAFYGCTYLEDLVLPASVRYVGDNTFALCAKLKKITVNSVTPPSIQAKTFFDVKRQIPVYVPDGSEDDYKAADGWKEFFNIQPVSAMPTAIDEMQVSESLNGTPRKVLVNGQLFILLPNGTRYNLQGMEIK